MVASAHWKVKKEEEEKVVKHPILCTLLFFLVGSMGSVEPVLQGEWRCLRKRGKV